MSTLDWSLQQATKTTAEIAAATTKIPKAGQIVWNTDTGKYCIGDGTTALSALTFYGGISASGLTVGTTTITGGTNTKVLYNNNGVVGEYTVTGSGSAVLSTSPVLTTPSLGVATGTSLIVGGGTNVGLDLGAVKNTNAIIGARTTLTTGFSEMFLQADSGTDYFATYFTGSAYTTSGLYTANSALIETYSSQFVISNQKANSPIVIATGGFAAANEKIRINTTGQVSGIVLTTSSTASGAVARGVYHTPTLIAAANSDVLYGHYIAPTFTNGAFTSVKNYALGVNGITRITHGSSFINIQEHTSFATYGAIYFANVPTATNYTMISDGNNTYFNSTTGNALAFRNNGVDVLNIKGLRTSGSHQNIDITLTANTGQTAGTNTPSFRINGASKQWATGTVALQYFTHIKGSTVAAVGASTFTHVSNFRSDAPLQGTNATATNLYAIDCGGHMFISNSVGVPSNNPTGGGIIYVEAGALKYRGSSGTVTVIGLA